MKSLYLDSSCLVSWVIRDESRAAALKKLLPGHQLHTSALSRLECQAGIEMGAGDARHFAEQEMLRVLSVFSCHPVGTDVLEEGRVLLRRHRRTLGLRSLDAIHVATAHLLNQEMLRVPGASPLLFLTADQRQFAAASAEGLPSRILA